MRYKTKSWGQFRDFRLVGNARGRCSGISGQSLIEFALVVPLLFLLIVNVVNFGGMMHTWVTVSHSVRTGAQYLMMGVATQNSPSPPTLAQVVALVALDLKGLPNSSGATVVVCKNNTNNTTTPVTCSDGSTPTLPSDPENASYTLGSVDVTYTFIPYVSLWRAFGVNLTTPPTSIHRRCVMRLGGA